MALPDDPKSAAEAAKPVDPPSPSVREPPVDPTAPPDLDALKSERGHSRPTPIRGPRDRGRR